MHRTDQKTARTTGLQKLPKSITCILAMATCTVGAAQGVEPGTRYIGFLGSYVNTDEGRGVDNGLGGHILYGLRTPAGWGLEGHILGSVFETGGAGRTDFYQQGIGFDLTYTYLNEESVSPFIFAGIGVMRNDVTKDVGRDSTGYYGNLGLGLVSPGIGASGVKFRGEARYVYDDFMDRYQDWRFSIGVEIPIGKPQPKQEPVVIEKVVARLVLPADADNDGVPDAVDQCPDTLTRTKVDRFGCAVEAQIVELYGVTFEFDSARLTEPARYALDRVASALKGQQTMEVEIAGHTDSVGPDEYNMALSLTRADSVRDYLVFRGIDANRMTAVGYGETQPIANNFTPEGRDLNRRTEFRILKR